MGGVGEKPNKPKSQAKKSTAVFGKNMPQYPQRWSGYPVQPDWTESEDDNASDSVPITHKKNTSVLSLSKQYFEGGPSYFKPTSKEVSEILNTKKTTGNNVPYMLRKDRNLTLGEEPDTKSEN